MFEHATFCWNELMTRDADSAADFYAEVLGWDALPMDMPGGMTYTVFRKSGKDVGGMMLMEGPQFEGLPVRWMSYVAVDDVDQSADKVAMAGGSVHQPPFDIPTVGRMAVVADPGGAIFGIITFLPQEPQAA